MTAAARKTSRLKFLCQRPVEYGLNEPSGSYAAEGIRFLRTTDIDDMGRLQQDTAVFLPPEKVGALRLQDGDFLISRSGTLGRSFVYSSRLHEECSFAGYLVRFRLRQAHDPRFLFYFTKSQDFAEWLKSNAIESTIGNINGQKYANMVVPFVEPNEQRAIAAFLDRETARLDGLVAQKEKLLALLEEKRASLITHAVTRGLNPDAPIKPSGIPWIGNIPKHWQEKRLKFLSPHITVGIVVTPAKYYVEQGVPCLRSFNIKENELQDTDLVYISEESNRLHSKSVLTKGDVVAVRTGQPGTTAVVDNRFDGANCIDLIIIRQSRKCDSSFLCHFMNSEFAKRQFTAGAEGAIQQHFNIETAGSLVVPVPPLSEQVAIAAFLGDVSTKFAMLAAASQRAIALLRERRTALISAAVTGQIDVRTPDAA